MADEGLKVTTYPQNLLHNGEELRERVLVTIVVEGRGEMVVQINWVEIRTSHSATIHVEETAHGSEFVLLIEGEKATIEHKGTWAVSAARALRRVHVGYIEVTEHDSHFREK